MASLLRAKVTGLYWQSVNDDFEIVKYPITDEFIAGAERLLEEDPRLKLGGTSPSSTGTSGVHNLDEQHVITPKRRG